MFKDIDLMPLVLILIFQNYVRLLTKMQEKTII